MRSPFLQTSALLLSTLLFATAADPSPLSEQEAAAGWKPLIDGSSTAGWVALGTTAFPTKGWSVVDGTLRHEKSGGGGDIVTSEAHLNFELTWEWKIGPGGNSGVKYNLPDPNKGVGFEFQMLDDERHPDAGKGPIHQTGALYDLIEPDASRKTKPAGEWNQSRILVDGPHVEQWLNGAKTVSFEIGSSALLERIANSKYKKVKDFGLKAASPILLQDHGGEAIFRDIKLRDLPAK